MLGVGEETEEAPCCQRTRGMGRAEAARGMRRGEGWRRWAGRATGGLHDEGVESAQNGRTTGEASDRGSLAGWHALQAETSRSSMDESGEAKCGGRTHGSIIEGEEEVA